MMPGATKRRLSSEFLPFMGALAVTLLLTPIIRAAQPVVEVLSAQLQIEEQLLERERDQYRQARSLEKDVLRQLQNSSNAQDLSIERVLREALAGTSQETPPNGQGSDGPSLMRTLRSAERELAGTRETAFALARENADRRRDLLGRAARIGELRQEIAKRTGARLVDSTGLDGLWEIELSGTDINGVIDFRSNGTLVTGTYRLSDGSQGSIRGTLANNRLDLERIDWSRGFDTTLRGEFNAAAGMLEGTWVALDVSGGAPGSGTWTARRNPR